MIKKITCSIILFIFLVASSTNVFSQTTIISSTGAGGFETGATFALNGWTEVNTPPLQTNQWFCGTAATGFTGARCAYVGTASTNNTYNVSTISVSHFYRDVTFPAGQPNITLSFSWKGFGEGSYDYMRVFLVPTTTAITAGTLLTTGQVGGDFNLFSTWQTTTLSIPCAAVGTTQRLVFSWRNDGSIGTNPAAAVDNISLVSNTTATCTSLLGTGVINVATLPYNSGAGTTCGQGNNLIASNTTVCGGTNYLTGEDVVWVFTPTTTGAVSFNLSAPTASFTGLMLYSGCPVNACSGPVATCIAFAQDFSGDKSFCANLTAGITYYLVLDSWSTPFCNAYSNLSIIPVVGSTCASLLGTGVVNVATLPYNSGVGTTCGQINNLTPTNMSTCGSSNYLTGEDRVWVFTPATSGQVNISLSAPAASYTALMLYSGCPVGTCGPGTGNCVAFAQDYLGDKALCINVTAGTTYYLVLDSYASPACNSYNNVSISAVTTGNAGATCASAVSIPSLPYAVSGHTTACMGDDYSNLTPGICNGPFAYGEDKVYEFTVSSFQCIGISISGATTNDVSYSVYMGCPGAGGVCVGFAGGANLGTLSGSVNLPAAGTYYLIIDTRNPSNIVTYNLTVSSYGAGAPNDRPFQAQAIPFNIPIAGNNNCSGGLDEPALQPACFEPAGINTMNSVWFSFTAPASGCVRMRTTLGTLSNTQIAVYGPVVGTVAAGAGNTLSLVGCSQDMPPCGFNTYPTSLLYLTGLSVGATYYIMVDGYASQTGSFTLFLMDAGAGCSIPLPPTPGQDCDLAFPVCKTNIYVANPGPQAVGSNCEFSSFTNCLASGERGSYWYKINIVANGFLEFNIVPNDWAGVPSTTATDYDFAVWRTKTAGAPGLANCSNLGTVPPVSCNYSFLGVTGCFSAVSGVAPAAYPGFGAAYQQRIPVTAGDEYLLNVSNFTNSTSGFALNFSAGSPIATVPPAGGTLVWTGTVSTDWYNPENWGGCAAPTCVFNVSIPSTPVNQPSVTGLTAVCGSIDITVGATLTLQAGAQFKVCKDLVNNGTINALANSTIIMQSDSVVQNQSMAGALAGVSKLWNLTINKPNTLGGNTVTLVNDLDVAGNFVVCSGAPWLGGTFNAAGRNHKVAGNFTVHFSSLPYGIYNPATTLEFNGAGVQNYFNRGALAGVMMNHTGPGVILGNSGAIDWMTVGGTLTLNQGRIITAANRVNVINNLAAAVSTGNISSFVEGNLKRTFAASGGLYDFPVGTAAKGYQRINFNFGVSNDRTNTTVSFNNTPPATPVPFLGPECTSALYDQTPLNHGYWQSEPIPSTGTAPYTVTAYNSSFTNPQTGYTVMYKSGAGMWGLTGSCVPASIIGAVQRSAVSTMGAFSQYGIAQSLTPLPVELLYLTAEPQKNSILVKWATASETINKGFEIQRSENPPEFKAVGWMPGYGTTNVTQEYKFNDTDVEKNVPYYYRLKQIDNNGQFEFSETVMALLTGKGYSFLVLPNPYINSTNLSVTLSEDADVVIEILSAVGQLITVPVKQRLTAGSYLYEFGASKYGWSKGVYLARITINQETSFIRLIELD